MGRRLYVNGEVVDVARDTITAGQLKQDHNFEPGSWVMADKGGALRQIGDQETIPNDVERISILPAYEYGQ